MEIFGELERFLSEVLYPYRVPLTAGFVLLTIALSAVAWRAGWITRAVAIVRRRPAPSALAAIAALALIVPAANYLVAPLWTRSEVVEASPLDAVAYAKEQETRPRPPVDAQPVVAAPTTSTVTTGGTASTAEAFHARVVSRGEWQGADEFHFARGQALIVEVARGQFVLRVEGFSVRNGPDLFVMLSPAADGYQDGAVKLGRLKATDGAFNYDIPPGANLDAFKSAVIWCEQFATLFGTATLIKAS